MAWAGRPSLLAIFAKSSSAIFDPEDLGFSGEDFLGMERLGSEKGSNSDSVSRTNIFAGEGRSSEFQFRDRHPAHRLGMSSESHECPQEQVQRLSSTCIFSIMVIDYRELITVVIRYRGNWLPEFVEGRRGDEVTSGGGGVTEGDSPAPTPSLFRIP